jgi:hypothetical protein
VGPDLAGDDSGKLTASTVVGNATVATVPAVVAQVCAMALIALMLLQQFCCFHAYYATLFRPGRSASCRFISFTLIYARAPTMDDVGAIDDMCPLLLSIGTRSIMINNSPSTVLAGYSLFEANIGRSSINPMSVAFDDHSHCVIAVDTERVSVFLAESREVLACTAFT